MRLEANIFSWVCAPTRLEKPVHFKKFAGLPAMEWLKQKYRGLCDTWNATSDSLSSRLGRADENVGWMRDGFVRGARGMVRESRRIEEEGTPLRDIFRFMRERVNETTIETYDKCAHISSIADARLVELRKQTVWLVDATVRRAPFTV